MASHKSFYNFCVVYIPIMTDFKLKNMKSQDRAGAGKISVKTGACELRV